MKKSVKAKNLDSFEKYLLSDNRMDITIKKYVHDVKIFLDFLAERKITEEILIEYKTYLLKKYAPTNAKSMIIAANKYLECCGTFLRINHSDVSGSSNMKKRELTMQEYSRLISAARSQNNDRLCMALETICAAGLQFSQLRYITVETVRNSYTTVESHGRKIQIYLPAALCAKLRNYCRKKGIDHGMIFVTRNGNPIDRSNLLHQIRKLCDEAKVDEDKIFPQNLKTLYIRTYKDLNREIVDRMGLIESAE